MRAQGLLHLLLLSGVALSCYIQNQDSGECMDAKDFAAYMPFCADVVTYRACVPKYNEMYSNHTIPTKDRFVQHWFNVIVEERKRYETDGSLQEKGQNEFGVPGEIIPRFSGDGGGADCVNAFRNFFCWMNFPRCDDEDQSLLLCKSVCENYFKACEYDEEDMWRCGPSKYQNAYSKESSNVQDIQGNFLFKRFFMTGQPFRDNSFDGGVPNVVCTPSILNAAGGVSISLFSLLFCVMTLAVLFVNPCR